MKKRKTPSKDEFVSAYITASESKKMQVQKMLMYELKQARMDKSQLQ